MEAHQQFEVANEHRDFMWTERSQGWRSAEAESKFWRFAYSEGRDWEMKVVTGRWAGMYHSASAAGSE